MTTLPRVGDEFAGYRLLAVLGRGGMSVVFQAENPRLGSLAALKVLAPELAENDLFRTRFLQESRTAASLSHPNVIPIYDMGSHEDLLFIAMRYVGGSDLRALLRSRRQLTPSEALYAVGQTGRALDLAHRHGLVHRDIKPANVLIEEGADAEDPDHVYLSDFGIAKHALSRSGLTDTGQFVGTALYVAPEQIQGHRVDGRADIYSLGCVLFECLVGQVPFVRDMDAAVLWAHVEDPPPRATALRPELPTAIDAVIARAMAKDPADRYPTSRGLMSEAKAAFADPHLSGRLLGPTPSMGPTPTGHDLTQPPLVGASPVPGSPAAPGRAESGPEHEALPTPPPLTPTRSPSAPRDLADRFAAGEGPAGAGSGGVGSDEAAPSGSGATPEGRADRTRPAPRTTLWATGAAVLTLAVIGFGAWALGRHDTGAAAGGRSTPPGSTATANVLMTAVAKADNPELPASSCRAVDEHHVRCANPYPGVSRVDLRRYPTLGTVYDRYVATTEKIGGRPLRTNQANCNGHTTSGEVSWNHDFQHPKGYTLAQSRSGTFDEGQAAGRVFCEFAGDAMHFVWTDNDGLMLGTVEGYQHPATWQWWHDVHHDLNPGYWATAAAGPHQDPMPSHTDMSDMNGMGSPSP